MIPESPSPHHAATLARLSQSGKVTRPKPRKTAMARILMAWELGAGFGHLAPLKPLAEALTARGHHVSFILHETLPAERLLGPQGYCWPQAPDGMRQKLIRCTAAAHSFAERLASHKVEDIPKRFAAFAETLLAAEAV